MKTKLLILGLLLAVSCHARPIPNRCAAPATGEPVLVEQQIHVQSVQPKSGLVVDIFFTIYVPVWVQNIWSRIGVPLR